MNILVTGGAGYIGSHTVIELTQQGHDVVIVDTLQNSSEEALRRIATITGEEIPFYKADVADKDALRAIFETHKIEAVIHFAGLKAVGESVQQPLAYYRNNIVSTLALCEVMQEKGVKKLIFSSSATVYGSCKILPLTEESQAGIGITNPYGQTKYMIETILTDLATADPDWEITLLRYFNPIGAHASGLIGESPKGLPNNLMPYITQVAVGKLKKLQVFGNDYDTTDGTGERDYIHVVDLAKGHIAALNHSTNGTHIYNLGTGNATSVLQLISALEKASNKQVPYEIAERRPGDLACNYADASKAQRKLNWVAEKNITDMCVDTWHWQSQNPKGLE